MGAFSSSMLRWACLVLLLLPACEPVNTPVHASPPPRAAFDEGRRGLFAIGAPVAARWSDGKWYYGTVASIHGERYSVDYADGDHGVVGPGEIVPIAAPERVTVGAHVLAVWKNASMYPGVVTQVSNGHATVQWDDGDLPLVVPLHHIALIEPPATTPTKITAGSLQVGDRVAAKWKDGHWWYGSIGQITAGGYVIHYADGDVWTVPTGAVRPVAPIGTLNIGDHVIAVWKGAKMYPGVITRIDAQSATVAWDDGDAPLDVPLPMIARD